MHSDRWLRELWADAVRMIRRGWRAILAAQVAFKIIELLIFAPITLAVLHALLGDTASIGNTALIGFALSPVGMAAILLLPTLLLAGLLIEQSCIVALMYDAAAGRSPDLSDALGLTLSRLKRLVGVATAIIPIVLAILLPLLLLAALTYWLLLSDADINYYLSNRPPKFLLAVAIGAILAIAGAVVLGWFYIRLFLVIPVCLYEDFPARLCLRRSAALSLGHRRKVTWVAVTSLILRSIMVQLTLLALALFNRYALSGQHHEPSTMVAIVAATLILNGLVLAVESAIDRALAAAMVVLMYRRLSPDHEFRAMAAETSAISRRTMARRLVAAAGLLFVLALTTSHTWLLMRQFSHRRVVGVTAHRAGAAHAPENTLAALQLAIAAGAGTAEIDVQRSVDGQIIVVHDRDLMRLGHSPLVVSQSTAEQLRAVDVGVPFSTKFTGERLGTLQEFIEMARGRIRLSVELKYYGGGDPELAAAVVRMLKENDFLGQSEIISLDYAALQQVRQLNRDIPTGFLVSASIGELTKLDVNFLSVSMANLTRGLRRSADDRGLRLAVWTTNTRDQMVRMMARGADELVTDEPALAVETVQWYQNLSDAELLLLHFREWWQEQ